VSPLAAVQLAFARARMSRVSFSASVERTLRGARLPAGANHPSIDAVTIFSGFQVKGDAGRTLPR
jgi:hypothetical protein